MTIYLQDIGLAASPNELTFSHLDADATHVGAPCDIQGGLRRAIHFQIDALESHWWRGVRHLDGEKRPRMIHPRAAS